MDLTRDAAEINHRVRSGSDGTVAITVPMNSNDVVLSKLTRASGARRDISRGCPLMELFSQISKTVGLLRQIAQHAHCEFSAWRKWTTPMSNEAECADSQREISHENRQDICRTVGSDGLLRQRYHHVGLMQQGSDDRDRGCFHDRGWGG